MDALINDWSLRCVFWTATKLETNTTAAFKEYASKRYSWISQVEHGKSGTNEHLHFLMINGPKETYNARNTLKKVLFPEDVKNGVVIDEHRLKAVTVTDPYAFLHYCGYMLKENPVFFYKTDDILTVDEINASLEKYKEQIAQTMEGFTKLSSRTQQHAASSCARYRILCEKYKLPLADYVDLFHALEADGIDTQWLIKDKFILFEYVSLKTQPKQFSRQRIERQMKQHGFLEDLPLSRLSAGYPHGNVPVRALAGYSVDKHSSCFIPPSNITTPPNGETPVSEEETSTPSETFYDPAPKSSEIPDLYSPSTHGIACTVKNKPVIRL